MGVEPILTGLLSITGNSTQDEHGSLLKMFGAAGLDPMRQRPQLSLTLFLSGTPIQDIRQRASEVRQEP
jgi:hypothetical protein